MPKPQAGNLDRTLRILQKSSVKDSFNQDITVFAEFHRCKCQLSPISNKPNSERNEEAQVYSLENLSFRIRYKNGIREDMIIEYQTDKYNIKSIYEPAGTRRQWLIIEAVNKQ